MYLPSVFLETDIGTVGAFVDKHPLATVALVANGRPHIDHIPFIRLSDLNPGACLVAHVAKGNDTWRLTAENPAALLVFSGASAYVSPSFYPSKSVSHEVVPTWNYVSVHITGTIRVSHDESEKRQIVDQLTRRMESDRPEPWSIDDAPPPYIEKMLSGIVALFFTIEKVDAKFKASQNKSRDDVSGVVDGLLSNSLTSEAGKIAEMKSK